MMGIDDSVEGEANDRTSIDLPDCQHQLAAALTGLKKPTIMVLLNAGPLAIAPEMVSVDAIIEAGYPGIFGAKAIAETIFGLNSHLGGKAIEAGDNNKKKKIERTNHLIPNS